MGANDISGFVLQEILNQEAEEEGYADLFTYIRNKPILSVQELLPTYDYVFDGSELRQYPIGYPTNIFLESLNDAVSGFLTSGVRLYNFVGDHPGLDTLTAVTVRNGDSYLPKWTHGYPVGFYERTGNRGLERGSGDSTVPLPSASFIQENLTTTQFDHNFIPDGAKADIFSVLTDNDAITIVDNFNLPNFKLILIKILSPADLLVVGPDGKKIGKDLNGQEINEIPNAFYTGFGADTEFITILNPLPGEYKVFSQGIGSGSYTVETNFISDATTTGASFTGNTAPGLLSEVDFGLSTTTNALSAKSVVTLESVLKDLDRLYALGWIKKNVYKKLREDLKDAVYTKKGKKVFDKDDLRDILKD
ncbi:MAG: hypothetical protein AABX37_04180, partial [Nanoarchaeota archaeon]